MNRIAFLTLAAALVACENQPQPAEPLLPDARPRTAVEVATGEGLVPDLQTVVPQQLQLMNAHQREILRFSNGIANTGLGPLHVRPAFPLTGEDDTQEAIQDVFDSAGDVVESTVVSEYEFHPTHNHWHIDGVALYEVHVGAPDGPVFGGNSIKTTFCLIDWVKLEGLSRQTERSYAACNADAQGISVGWVDQYHQATPDQQVDITGAPEGLYYLVSTANPDGTFIESDYTNNTAWVAFMLERTSQGNARIRIMDHSPCEGGLCGAPANR